MIERTRRQERTMLIRGAALLAVLTVVIGLLFVQARGSFSGDVDVTAKLSSVGDGLAPGADVKYRGVLVGRVTEVDVRPTGGADVTIRLREEHVDDVPADVLVRRVPSNVFAQPSIELTDPPGSELPRSPVTADDVLAEDTSKESLEIQTAITKAYDLVSALRPKELTIALDAIAQALDGNGADLGQILVRADRYLAALVGRRERINAILHEGVRAIAAIRDSAPDLLAAVEDALVPARTLAESQAEIQALVGAATDLTDLGQDFLDQNLARIITVVHDLRPVAQALGLRRSAITGSFFQLSRFVSWGRRIQQGADGPIVRLDFRSSSEILHPYDAADCASYPGIAGVPAMIGLNCGNGASRQPARSQVPGGTVGPVGGPGERAMVHALTAALGGSEDPANDTGGDASVLLLAPLLRGSRVVTER